MFHKATHKHICMNKHTHTQAENSANLEKKYEWTQVYHSTLYDT